MNTVTRRLEWDSGHRLVNHEGQCKHVHGHRYRAEIECASYVLDDVGRVVDFGVVKAKVKPWIDEHWDHAFLADEADVAMIEFLQSIESKHCVVPGSPTAENIARWLYESCVSLLETDRVRVVSVAIWETPNCCAVYRP